MVQIRNRLGALACAAALSLVGSAHATTFDFSYTFGGTGDTITGTVQGTLDGGFVDSLHDLTLSYDGHAFSAATVGQTWDASVVDFTSAPVRLAFDGSLNQFLFSDGTLSFGFVNDVANLGGTNVFASDLSLVENNADFDTATSSWHLVAAPIPEP
ncbi:MAG: hypothetical protein M3N82_16320, partial [Pseudomonadota bacterium]|nr:hypothetical protein [Pseudomonadota bacterium]